MQAGDVIKNKPFTVVHFQRKPLPIHKSIENIFEDLRKRLPAHITSRTVVFNYFSKGLVPRLKIMLQARKSQGDVNHITGDVHFCAILLKKRKTMMTIHDCRLLTESRGIKYQVFRFFWYTLPLKKCALITVISAATKNELLRHVRYPEDRLHIIPNAISDAFTWSPKPFNKTRPVILQVGTTENKNIYRLLQAIKGLNCHLKMIGLLNEQLTRALDESLVSYSSAHNLTEAELVYEYQQCDIVSFVSTYEGFGMPVIEANETGRVIVTSNVMSLPEVAGNAACIVDPYDVDDIRRGFMQVINDENYREQLIQNGRENCKRFSGTYIANQYAALYEALAQNKN